jgi:hypothetical protein
MSSSAKCLYLIPVCCDRCSFERLMSNGDRSQCVRVLIVNYKFFQVSIAMCSCCINSLAKYILRSLL